MNRKQTIILTAFGFVLFAIITVIAWLYLPYNIAYYMTFGLLFSLAMEGYNLTVAWAKKRKASKVSPQQ